MRLELVQGELAVHRLARGADLPVPARGGPLFCLLKTDDGVTVICSVSIAVPGSRVQRRWRALRISGPIALDETGILAGLSRVLAEAGISMLVLSSYETDHILVGESDLANARAALGSAGYRLDEAPESQGV